ncbi:ABC transporter ATP-binding protein [Candidatus Dependentiae bacterium]|nr:ABC transporter ATP-binding protein [Candidatus Dependentiae bacterium]
MPDILLRINNIKKTYYGKHITIEALKDVSLDVYKGEILGLLGVNGAGKTTLSSIIATLHPPTSGDILMNGKSIYENVIAFRSLLGFCPQKPNFERTLSIEENLLFAGRYYLMPEDLIKKRIAELLDQFALAKYAKATPDILSGGYKQRLLIVRALIHKPQLVILDEPTVGLDPHIRRQLWDVILGLKNEGVTVLLTTHYLDEAEYLSSRVCILDKGIVQALDTPENLLRTHQNTSLEQVFINITKEQSEQKEPVV